MIRFVYIPEDAMVVPDSDCFAWFSTVTDEFLDFGGEQVFATWYEFEEAWDENRTYPLERFRGLFPKEDK